MNKVYTSNYNCCKFGNMISISGDRGKRENFTGKTLQVLAPKREFWNIWHDNIDKISQYENARYYIEQYYKQVLSKIDIEQILKDEIDPILLCYESSSEFCHRHIIAEYINIMFGIEVYEIEIDENLKVKYNARPEYIRDILIEVIEKS